MKRTIVVSAIALQSGGTLSILQDCLRELSRTAYREYEIHIILKDKALAGGDYPSLNFIKVDGTRSYFHRWYYEYYKFNAISRKLRPDLWLSLHDITPNVSAATRAVYCHNPSPFYSITPREFFIDPKFGLFTWLYWILYKINIHKNDFVVVQQQWLRTAFARKFSLAENRIIVARPDNEALPASQMGSTGHTFFYPSFPRVFKNFELIGHAVQLLHSKGIQHFRVILTLDGTENKYARMIRRQFGHLPEIIWMGLVARSKVFEVYTECDYLIFPSRLETWGLPISEFRSTGKPILLADLPYAHETAGNYPSLIFFDPRDAVQLAGQMECLISGKTMPHDPPDVVRPNAPAADTWSELFKIMLKN